MTTIAGTISNPLQRVWSWIRANWRVLAIQGVIAVVVAISYYLLCKVNPLTLSNKGGLNIRLALLLRPLGLINPASAIGCAFGALGYSAIDKHQAGFGLYMIDPFVTSAIWIAGGMVLRRYKKIDSRAWTALAVLACSTLASAVVAINVVFFDSDPRKVPLTVVGVLIAFLWRIVLQFLFASIEFPFLKNSKFAWSKNKWAQKEV